MLWIQYPLGPWTGRIASGLWLGQAGTKYKSISGSILEYPEGLNSTLCSTLFFFLCSTLATILFLSSITP